ncbi:endonuclease domain-containing 1 protein-like [Pseudophryne corroboree]|uniref:endonuclease domain-containing 1 protein-like n=1 Tax=Pseudophryne corroboree TaxID=495146 RepID=UPI003081E059
MLSTFKRVMMIPYFVKCFRNKTATIADLIESADLTCENVQAPSVTLMSSAESLDSSNLIHIACLVTGFYPPVIEVTWKVDGQTAPGDIIAGPTQSEEVLALAHATMGKVSSNFNDCLGQFYGSTPPVGFTTLQGTITPICQMYDNYNNPFFASLYHEGYRYPLYSAYILDIRPGAATGASQTFRLEPQLVDIKLLPQQMLQPQTETAIRNLGLSDPVKLIKNTQAINSDYTGSNYHKGHLNPNADHPDGPGQLVTYTLTNIAPMHGPLNSGTWRANEMKVRHIAATCDKMYVITGVVPGNNWIPNNINQRVNIPSHIWSAFCCLNNNNQPIKAEGSLAQNDANWVDYGLTIIDLQTKLRTLLGVSVTLFQNNCS